MPGPGERREEQTIGEDRAGEYELDKDRVHIWRAGLDVDNARLEKLGRFLARDELETASRFHFPKDRERFIAGRGMLRVLLGHYMQMRPDEIQLAYGPYGKPVLSNAPPHNSFNFNVSHAGGLVLYAITRAGRIGIDLERVVADFDWQEIADHFFSVREKAVLRTLPENARHDTFFQFWTRKEAYFKAMGEGLSLALNRWQAVSDHATGWTLYTFVPKPGYAAAVAVEAEGCRFSFSECERTDAPSLPPLRPLFAQDSLGKS
ncbi:MAG TPA: 4'-phosphopantetheinyl transferase superfamily protein [Anaerolineae bacterium]